jgi:DNA-binding transcriptional ArsR family regulator
MILNPDNICLVCGGPKGRKAMTCPTCSDGSPCTNLGRPQTYSDAQIVTIIGAHAPSMTVDDLLLALGLKSKTTLIKRLRRMRDAGLIRMEERTRREGFIIRPTEEASR